MDITFDPDKRATTLEERGIDFAVDAAKVFAGHTVTVAADRIDYGEARWLTAGRLNERMAIVIWTPRGKARDDFDEVLSCQRASQTPRRV